MKLITAIIRPGKLDEVMHAASEAGARGLTATDVRGFGQQFGHLGPGGPTDEKALVLPKTRIDIVVRDESVDHVIQAIAKTVNTGNVGDGKIWVCPVEGVLRVRTGETDWKAV